MFAKLMLVLAIVSYGESKSLVEYFNMIKDIDLSPHIDLVYEYMDSTKIGPGELLPIKDISLPYKEVSPGESYSFEISPSSMDYPIQIFYSSSEFSPFDFSLSCQVSIFKICLRPLKLQQPKVVSNFFTYKKH